MFGQDGANELSIKEIEDFLNAEGAATPTADDEESSPASQPNTNDGTLPYTVTSSTGGITETQAFAHRLKEETAKIRREERDNIAKDLGYENYAEMQKARENELFKENGLNPDEVSPIVEQIVQKRLAEDPRLKELDNYRQQQISEWAKKELVELQDLTGGKISKMEEVPKEVIELWKTKGSLKAAYLELKGEELIREMRAGVASGQNRGSTDHLKSASGGTAPVIDENKRPFTEQEKEIYRLFNPEVTEEQLSKLKKTI